MNTTTQPPQPQPAEPQEPPPLSPQRLAANRANALLSTGPRTSAGQAPSSQPALPHGLRARLDPGPLVPQNEQPDFRDALCPQSPLEDLLVERIALLGWKL